MRNTTISARGRRGGRVKRALSAFGALTIVAVLMSGAASAAPIAGKLVISPVPIAPSGSLPAKGVVTVTVTAETAGGLPLGGAMVYLSFTPAPGGGSATTHKVTLTSNAVAVRTDPGGNITVAYHAPANPQPTSGTDTLTAANTASAPTATATDGYTFSAVTYGLSSLKASPNPIAAAHSLSAKSIVTIAVTAKTSQGAVVPRADVFLSFARAAGGGTAAAHGHLLSSKPQLFKADVNGVISVIYRTGLTMPTTGTDIVKFENAPTQPTVTGTDSYAY